MRRAILPRGVVRTLVLEGEALAVSLGVFVVVLLCLSLAGCGPTAATAGPHHQGMPAQGRPAAR